MVAKKIKKLFQFLRHFVPSFSINGESAFLFPLDFEILHRPYRLLLWSLRKRIEKIIPMKVFNRRRTLDLL